MFGTQQQPSAVFGTGGLVSPVCSVIRSRQIGGVIKEQRFSDHAVPLRAVGCCHFRIHFVRRKPAGQQHRAYGKALGPPATIAPELPAIADDSLFTLSLVSRPPVHRE